MNNRLDFLPTTPADVKARGWSEVDFVYVTGDAYVDHPKASLFEVSEEKTVNKRFFKRSPTNASERCRVTQAPVHDTVVVR